MTVALFLFYFCCHSREWQSARVRPAECGNILFVWVGLSFPNVVVGNLFFAVVALFNNSRSPTETFGDDGKDDNNRLKP